MRVMLVDDDAPMRQVLAKLLHTSGFDSVIEVSDGKEALASLLSDRVDLIVIDDLVHGQRQGLREHLVGPRQATSWN